MASGGLRNRSNSYGRNLRLLKGINPVDEEDHHELADVTKSPADQNKWLFEVAWEVANKGEPIVTFSSILLVHSLVIKICKAPSCKTSWRVNEYV